MVVHELFPASLPRIISGKAVRMALGISPPTMLKLIRDGKLPRPLRLGPVKSWFATAEVREFLMRLYDKGGAQ
jgi:predicted DNA-binding transcriptional regulator AlpA